MGIKWEVLTQNICFPRGRRVTSIKVFYCTSLIDDTNVLNNDNLLLNTDQIYVSQGQIVNMSCHSIIYMFDLSSEKS